MERVEIEERAPFEHGKDYPGSGPYEIIKGRAWFALDPKHPANSRIVDLKLAPRDSRGLVVFTSKFVLTRPAADVDTTWIFDIPNRGSGAAILFNDAPDPAGKLPYIDDGFLQRHAFTTLSSAWAWDVETEGADDERLVFEPPIARGGRRPITGIVSNEFMVSAFSRTASFVGINGKAYRAATRNDAHATLTARPRPDARRIQIPRGHWTFVETGSSPPTKVRLKGGFRPGTIYELTYRARDPYVVGAGLAAIRDLLSWFRANPFAGKAPAERVVILGFSQTGRVIRHMLHEGLNVGEDGKLVFDGGIAAVAGAGRGSFNHRFAFPTRAASQVADRAYPTDLPPFSVSPDPSGPASQTLVARAADVAGQLPKLFFINNSSEYWGRAASLLTTSADGKQDLVPASFARHYMLSGVQHYSSVEERPFKTVACANPVDRMPTMRALLLQMEAWVRKGHMPSPDQVPTVAGGTAVAPATFVERFPRGVGLPLPAMPYAPSHLDFGHRFSAEGIIDLHPPRRGRRYAVRVAAPDADGSDLGGLRPVEVAVPLGTFTGWNRSSPRTGLAWANDRFLGAFVPFARTEKERRAAGDSRPSIEARYGTREEFLAKTKRAAEAAVESRTLLAEDVDRVVSGQAALHDRIIGRAPGSQDCKFLMP